MAVAASIPQLATVFGAAAIDSINPCAIGVLILLISLVVASRKNRDNLLKFGLIYITAVYVTYFLAGLGLIFFFSKIPISLAEYLSVGVGTVVVFGGMVEIKDYFWYGEGLSLSISPDRAKQIHDYTEHLTLPGLIFLGAFVAGVELPCTGGPYLAITTLLSQQFNMTALILLIIYNIIFVLPLVAILLMAVAGTKISDLKKWKQKNRAYMRLGTGILLIALGWVLILIANGTISFI